VWASTNRDAVFGLGGCASARVLAQNDRVAHNRQFGSFHPGIVQFVFGDASVRTLRRSLPGTTLELLTNRGDGLAIPALD
jgi:hypothetical protein